MSDLKGTMVINDEGNFVIEMYDPMGRSIKKVMDRDETIKEFIKRDIVMNSLTSDIDKEVNKFMKHRSKAYDVLEEATKNNKKKTMDQQMKIIQQIAMIKEDKSVSLPEELHQAVLSVEGFATWRQKLLDFLRKEKEERYDYLIDNYSEYYEKYLKIFNEVGKKVSS